MEPLTPKNIANKNASKFTSHDYGAQLIEQLRTMDGYTGKSCKNFIHVDIQASLSFAKALAGQEWSVVAVHSPKTGAQVDALFSINSELHSVAVPTAFIAKNPYSAALAAMDTIDFKIRDFKNDILLLGRKQEKCDNFDEKFEISDKIRNLSDLLATFTNNKKTENFIVRRVANLNLTHTYTLRTDILVWCKLNIRYPYSLSGTFSKPQIDFFSVDDRDAFRSKFPCVNCINQF